jgi:selenoprotein W-related protein
VAEEILKAKTNQISSLRLVPSSGGVFEVTAAGRTIFSKKATGRRPEPGEVLSALEARGH